eukprot:5229235-Pyramimonas_sp.AAC.1
MEWRFTIPVALAGVAARYRPQLPRRRGLSPLEQTLEDGARKGGGRGVWPGRGSRVAGAGRPEICS